tara:strand:- start:10462 stop:10905 length:444 start_codon:yes stop_codon:yes gene_type:complete
MTKQIKTAIQINANKETVWNVLMDFEKYSEWNPFIKSITGAVEIGNKLHVKFHGMSFKPKVVTLNKNSEFKWLGHLLFKGLFDGEHRFFLIENTDGTTTFEQSEVFNGLLLPLFSKSLDTDTKSSFHKMNEQLKIRAEIMCEMAAID